MTPYSFALTVFRLIAVGLLLELLFLWVVISFLPGADVGSGAQILQSPGVLTNFPNLAEMQHQSAAVQHQFMARASLVVLGIGAFIYLLAPFLARVVTIGQNNG